jgi:hypothetical protein
MGLFHWFWSLVVPLPLPLLGMVPLAVIVVLLRWLSSLRDSLPLCGFTSSIPIAILGKHLNLLSFIP